MLRISKVATYFFMVCFLLCLFFGLFEKLARVPSRPGGYLTIPHPCSKFFFGNGGFSIGIF
jgi:hypothetical protein